MTGYVKSANYITNLKQLNIYNHSYNKEHTNRYNCSFFEEIFGPNKLMGINRYDDYYNGCISYYIDSRHINDTYSYI